MGKSLSSRMAEYEKAGGGGEILIPHLPIVVRLDGRAFSQYTRKMEKPFDAGLSYVFDKATTELVQHFVPVIGYTASDEITLLFEQGSQESELPFGGRKQKLLSVIASACTSFFVYHILDLYYVKYGRNEWNMSDDAVRKVLTPQFDCKIFQVPNRAEAVNALLDREQSTLRNAIQMLARSHFSHKELQGLNGKEMQEKLFQEKSVNFNDLDDRLKRGQYFRREVVRHELSEEHQVYRSPYDLPWYVRTEVRPMHLPPLLRIQNREEVIFCGEEPVLLSEEIPNSLLADNTYI